MFPVRRNLHFRLGAADVGHWHARGAALTHFINAMSLTFPEGERFFIQSVRHFRDRIDDPALQEAVAGFIGQEAMHSREHDEYNLLLSEAGLPVAALEDALAAFFRALRGLPPAVQLSITMAQEHVTAIVAARMLSDPRIIEGAGGRLAAFWRWHALEEIEHKAVAFDVYRAAVGSGPQAYALRTASYVLTTFGFLAMVLWCQLRLRHADPRPGGREGLGRFAKFMLVSPGLLPSLARPWLRWFAPGFHPWQHDDRHLLWEIAPLSALLDERPAGPRASSRAAA